MTIRAWVHEFRRRWPAIRGILRDGTVVYRATIEEGTLVVRRPNSAILDSNFIRAEAPPVNFYREPSLAD